MNVILLLVFGLAVGLIGRGLVPGQRSGGWIASMFLGALGSLLGAFIGMLFGLDVQGDTAGWLVAASGAFVCVLAYEASAAQRNLLRSR